MQYIYDLVQRITIAPTLASIFCFMICAVIGERKSFFCYVIVISYVLSLIASILILSWIRIAIDIMLLLIWGGQLRKEIREEKMQKDQHEHIE